ncbi:MAG: M48 family metalloprotease, partial [Phycisphaerales bacterium]|nr:M48 family metalloprotease [Phycisphaerales bacterium]
MNDQIMSLLVGPWGQRIGWTLVHFLWQGALVAALLAVAIQFLRRGRPQVRYVAACCALGLLVVMPVVTAAVVSPVVSHVPVAVVDSPSPQPNGTNMGTVRDAASVFDADFRERCQTTQQVAGGSSVWGLRFESFIEMCLPWCVMLWLAGLVLISLWHVSGWLLLQRIRWHAKPPLDSRVVEVFRKMAERLRVRRGVAILESVLVQAPAVIGWLRPAIVVPASVLTGLSSDQLQAILAHELAHIRRWDTLVRMVQAAVETVLFFHPAVWWVSAVLTQESEYCCDEIALEVCGDRKTYVRALAFAAGITGGSSPGLAPAATGGKLMPRLRRILGKAGERSTSRAFVAAGIALVLIAAFIPLACSIESKDKDIAETQTALREAMSAQGVTIKTNWASKTWRIGEDVPKVIATVAVEDWEAFNAAELTEAARPTLGLHVAINQLGPLGNFRRGELTTIPIFHTEYSFTLEVDGVRYEYPIQDWVLPMPMGKQPIQVTLTLADHWVTGHATSEGQARWQKQWEKSLRLEPGKHRVRVLFTGLEQDPPPASEEVEIEILPRERKLA